jgi:hypothetical protein
MKGDRQTDRCKACQGETMQQRDTAEERQKERDEAGERKS